MSHTVQNVQDVRLRDLTLQQVQKVFTQENSLKAQIRILDTWVPEHIEESHHFIQGWLARVETQLSAEEMQVGNKEQFQSKYQSAKKIALASRMVFEQMSRKLDEQRTTYSQAALQHGLQIREKDEAINLERTKKIEAGVKAGKAISKHVERNRRLEEENRQLREQLETQSSTQARDIERAKAELLVIADTTDASASASPVPAALLSLSTADEALPSTTPPSASPASADDASPLPSAASSNPAIPRRTTPSFVAAKLAGKQEEFSAASSTSTPPRSPTAPRRASPLPPQTSSSQPRGVIAGKKAEKKKDSASSQVNPPIAMRRWIGEQGKELTAFTKIINQLDSVYKQKTVQIHDRDLIDTLITKCREKLLELEQAIQRYPRESTQDKIIAIIRGREHGLIRYSQLLAERLHRANALPEALVTELRAQNILPPAPPAPSLFSWATLTGLWAPDPVRTAQNTTTNV